MRKLREAAETVVEARVALRRRVRGSCIVVVGVVVGLLVVGLLVDVKVE